MEQATASKVLTITVPQDEFFKLRSGELKCAKKKKSKFIEEKILDDNGAFLDFDDLEILCGLKQIKKPFRKIHLTTAEYENGRFPTYAIVVN